MNNLARLNEALKGGKGSGDHGHSGRPGKRGGSSGGSGGGSAAQKPQSAAAAQKREVAGKMLSKATNAGTAANAFAKHVGGHKRKNYGGQPLSARAEVGGIPLSKRSNAEKVLAAAGYTKEETHAGYGKGGENLSITEYSGPKGFSAQLTHDKRDNYFDVEFTHSASASSYQQGQERAAIRRTGYYD